MPWPRPFLLCLALSACAGAPPKVVTPDSARPFSSDSPWNQPIAEGAPLDADSAALVADLVASAEGTPGPWINQSEWTIPRYFADASTPTYEVEVSRLRGEGFEVGAKIPIPDDAEPDPQADHHMLVLDLAQRRAFDFFKAARTATGWSCVVCAAISLDGPGVRPPEDSANPWTLAHGSRACGFPLVAGLVTPEEIKAGVIEHALEISVRRVRANQYVSPASTGHGGTNEVLPGRGLRCGTRVRLDPSVDIDALGLSPAARVIARALVHYGAYVGDFAGGVAFVVDGSARAQAQWQGVLQSGDLKTLPLDRFQVLAPEPPIHEKKL